MQEMTATTVRDFPNIGDEVAWRLVEAGYVTMEDIREAPIEDLLDIHGIGPKKASALKEQ